MREHTEQEIRLKNQKEQGGIWPNQQWPNTQRMVEFFCTSVVIRYD